MPDIPFDPRKVGGNKYDFLNTENARVVIKKSLDKAIYSLLSDEATESSKLIEGGGGQSNTVTYFVTDPNSLRPDAVTVIWVGGQQRPVHMAEADIWFSTTQAEQPPTVDSEAPTTPTNLVISNPTANGFTVSWSPSSDNVGVTGYTVVVNDTITATTTTATTATVGGLVPETTYNVQVRARDAIGNFSTLSSTVTATTIAIPEDVGIEHSIWGASAPSDFDAMSKYTETEVEAGNTFYTFGSGVSGWKVVGMRIYVPAEISMPSGGSANLYHWVPPAAADFAVKKTATIDSNSLISGQWNEVRFPTETVISAGDLVLLTYKLSDGSYLHVPRGSATAFIKAKDNSSVVLSETILIVGESSYYSAYVKAPSLNGGNFGSAFNDPYYGVDIIVEEA